MLKNVYLCFLYKVSTEKKSFIYFKWEIGYALTNFAHFGKPLLIGKRLYVSSCINWVIRPSTRESDINLDFVLVWYYSCTCSRIKIVRCQLLVLLFGSLQFFLIFKDFVILKYALFFQQLLQMLVFSVLFVFFYNLINSNCYIALVDSLLMNAIIPPGLKVYMLVHLFIVKHFSQPQCAAPFLLIYTATTLGAIY